MCGEPIHGTATAAVEVWLLIEYRERWEPDIANCAFPPGIDARLRELTKLHPELRVQLVRQFDRQGPLCLYVILNGPMRAVHRYELERHEDILSVDLEGLVSGELTTVVGNRPVYLVCTHGSRDRCCSMYGVPFYKALVEAQPEADVWQSSHHGGHRFAANVIYLPFGLHYGRLDPGEAPGMAEAHAHGDIYALGRYRGQTRYSSAVQAAEAWLREQEQILGIDGLEIVDERPLPDGSVAARFRVPDGTVHRVTVAPRHGRIARLASCGKGSPELPQWFQMVRHEARMPRAGGSVDSTPGGGAPPRGERG
jgi:hypothetical protein